MYICRTCTVVSKMAFLVKSGFSSFFSYSTEVYELKKICHVEDKLHAVSEVHVGL